MSATLPEHDVKDKGAEWVLQLPRVAAYLARQDQA